LQILQKRALSVAAARALVEQVADDDDEELDEDPEEDEESDLDLPLPPFLLELEVGE
jgi:hypothetical protein